MDLRRSHPHREAVQQEPNIYEVQSVLAGYVLV